MDACSTSAESLSINVTGKIVLCYVRAPPRPGLREAINFTKVGGARGLIFAHHGESSVEELDECNGVMPCVLVDFEVAQRILSYRLATGYVHTTCEVLGKNRMKNTLPLIDYHY